MRLIVSKRNYDALNTKAGEDRGGELRMDTYRERLVKYIPVETVALFITVYGITYYLSGSESWYPVVARWIFLAGVISTALYLWIAENVRDWIQVVISMAGFLIWVCALGVVTVTSLPYYNAIVAGLLLPVWVFLAPFIEGMPEQW